jgi:hypothetical protein
MQARSFLETAIEAQVSKLTHILGFATSLKKPLAC